MDLTTGRTDGYCGHWEAGLCPAPAPVVEEPAPVAEVDDETALLRINIYLAGIIRREEDRLAGQPQSYKLLVCRDVVDLLRELS